VRELQRAGTRVFDRITARFGPDVVAADGELDRAHLRALVLADPAARRDLEAIVHPAVAVERERLITDARRRGAPIVVSDIPLLFEVMDPDAFDAVVLVDAPEEMRRARLARDRGLSDEEIDGLFRAQQPTADKRARSDYIIDNDSTREELRTRAWRVWRRLHSLARTHA
jgi:dephospho-CoA kinase